MIYILTGAVGAGKTTFLRGLVEDLRKAGVPFDGFLSLRVMTGGKPEGYQMLDVRDGRGLALLRRTDYEKGERVGPYVMLPRPLEKRRSRPAGGRRRQEAAGGACIIADFWIAVRSKLSCI